jgi:hypothetical protein
MADLMSGIKYFIVRVCVMTLSVAKIVQVWDSGDFAS